MHSDLLIIGGGVIGLSIARELRKRGPGRITIVDKGVIGGESSWAAAGMLAPNAETHADDPLFDLCTASNALYPRFAEELYEETGIDIELDRTGTLELAFTNADAECLSDKFRWQQNNGVAVESLTGKEILEIEPRVSPRVRMGLRYPNDWQVENRKLTTALRRFCELNRIELLEDTEVTGLIVEDERLNGVRIAKGEIWADLTIIASGAWTGELIRTDVPAAETIKPIRGQMIGFDTGERVIDHVIYSPRGYIVPRADGRVLVGATVEDVGFNKEVTVDAVESLRAAALEIAPDLADFDIKEAWAGLRPFAAGGLPLIGPVVGVGNAFMATGHYRNGILLAPITARMIADDVFGSRHQLGFPQLGVPPLGGPTLPRDISFLRKAS